MNLEQRARFRQHERSEPRHGVGRGRTRSGSRSRRSLVLAAVVASMVGGIGASVGIDMPARANATVDAGTAPAGTPDAKMTQADGLDVTSYDIDMDYRPDPRELTGDTTISARATDALDSVTFQLDSFTIRSVTVDSKAASFSRTNDKELVVDLPERIERGERFRIRIDYHGTPGPGWMPTTSGGGVATLGNNSSWFPVREGVDDKADFNVTARVPEGWSVVSIGREVPTRQASGRNTFGWTEQDVYPTHVAVAVDRFTIERSTLPDGTSIIDAYAPGLRKANKPLGDALPEILDFLSGTFGPYPFRTGGNVFVHVSDNAPATAPQSRPIYLGAGNERFMTLDAVVHEQAHQWFGVSVTHDRPEDLCLSECLASYATWLWDEEKNDVDLDARYRNQVDANSDDASWWTKLYRPGRQPTLNLYEKGPLAIHALRRELGDEAFFDLTRRYPLRHHGEQVTWPEFEADVQKITGRDLDGFLEAWFRSGTIPDDQYLWPGALRP